MDLPKSLFLPALVLLPAVVLGAQEISPRYTGGRISLHLKDTDLHEFFHLIHRISNLNIVAGSEVGGTVTVDLIDVPWDQALELVLRTHHLGGEREGSVLLVRSWEATLKEKEARKELARAEEAAAPLRTVAYSLSYAHAAHVAQILRPLLSPRGNITVDAPTNSIIITDVPSVLEKILGSVSQRGSSPRPPF